MTRSDRRDLKHYLDLAAAGGTLRIRRASGGSFVLMPEDRYAAMRAEILSLRRRLLGMTQALEGAGRVVEPEAPAADVTARRDAARHARRRAIAARLADIDATLRLRGHDDRWIALVLEGRVAVAEPGHEEGDDGTMSLAAYVDAFPGAPDWRERVDEAEREIRSHIGAAPSGR